MTALALNYIEPKLKSSYPKKPEVFTREITHVLVTGLTDEIFRVGCYLNNQSLSVKYHNDCISTAHGAVKKGTIAILLVDDGDQTDLKQGVVNIREIDSKIPIIVLTRGELQSDAAKSYFAIGASDIIHSIQEIPRFQEFITEHCKLGSSTYDPGACRKERRISKAIIARIRALTNLRAKISVSVRNRTAFITGRIRSLKRKQLLEEVALATPGVSNVVLTNVVTVSSLAPKWKGQPWWLL